MVKWSNRRAPKERAADFYKKKIASAKARPATLKTLQNAILVHFLKLPSPIEIDKVIEELKKAGHVVVNGSRVEYPRHG